MTKGLGRVALYLRVSTDLQETFSQMEALEAWLKALPPEKRPTSKRIFQDRGWSGYRDDRPGILTILDLAKAKEIDTLITFSLDRISRSATMALRYILELDSLGVAFIATSQPILNLGHENPFRRTMLAAFAEIAEVERQMIVTRIKAGMAAAKKRGSQIGNPGIPKETRYKIIRLWEEGLGTMAISRKAKVSRYTVWRVLRGRASPFPGEPEAREGSGH